MAFAIIALVRFVIDITQLVHWPGNLTGIPRVMDELALRFMNDGKVDAIFVSWVKELEQMCEVDFRKSRPNRGKGITFVTKDRNTAASSLEEKDILDIRILRASSPDVVKKAVKNLAVKSRFDRTSIYRKVLSTKRSIELQSYKPYIPESGDKLFIPWGEWWDKNWLALMKDFSVLGVEIYPVCHDILPMIVPQYSGNSSSLEEFIIQVFPVSKTVVANSNSTKQDLDGWMKSKGLSVPSIKTFRLGEDFTFSKNAHTSSVAKKYSVEKSGYIMYVSTIEPRKNHTLLYYVYKLAKSRDISLPKLLVIGRVGHDSNVLIKIIQNDPEVNQNILICNNVDDTELNWLYENCLFSVAPSFYEGWGMPVLESIARGKPVVCADTSSLREMPADCIIFFNPSSTDECLSAITSMLETKVLEKYIENTKKYKPHSWDESYQQVLAIMEEK